MNGLTLYEGPSAIGPDPIVVLASSIGRTSANMKTGDCVQVYIELRDQHPQEARKAGTDVSNCGDCSLKPSLKNPDGECYVPGYMLNQPWSSWKATPQAYPHGSLQNLPQWKPIRVGAHGDMAAVPNAAVFWLEQLRGHQWLAYTSQWRTQRLQALAMASVQSPAEQAQAQAMGYRTYRRYRGTLELLTREIECPFPRVQCRGCLLCNGKGQTDQRKHIAVRDTKEKGLHERIRRATGVGDGVGARGGARTSAPRVG